MDKSGHVQRAFNVSSGSSLQWEHVVFVINMRRARLTLVGSESFPARHMSNWIRFGTSNFQIPFHVFFIAPIEDELGADGVDPIMVSRPENCVRPIREA